MPYTIVRATVEDFPSWRRQFDENADAREEAGSNGGHLFRNADDHDEVVVFLAWEEEDGARGYVDSEAFREGWEAGGVSDGPEVTFLEELSRPRS